MASTITTTWRQKLSEVLEWSPVDKGQILLLMLIPILGQYMLWAWVMLHHPERNKLVNAAGTWQLLHWEAWMLVGAVALAGLGLYLRRRAPDRLWFQHLTVQYYAVVLVFLGYQVGLNAVATGIVLMGAPVFGFIVMDRRAIWLGTATAVTLFLGFSLASAYELLPYAPSLVPPSDAESARYYTLSILAFAAPHFILIFLLADHMVGVLAQA